VIKAAKTPNIVPPAASMMKFQKLSCPWGQRYRFRTTLADVYDDRAITNIISFHSKIKTFRAAQRSRGFDVWESFLSRLMVLWCCANSFGFAVFIHPSPLYRDASTVLGPSCSSRYVSLVVWIAMRKMRQIRECHELGYLALGVGRYAAGCARRCIGKADD
jgi:hypothetical protein